MSTLTFDEVANALRDAVLDWYRDHGEHLTGAPGWNTLETNSGFVERRGAPLLEMLSDHAGIRSIKASKLVDLGAGFGALSVYFAFRGATVTAIDVNEQRLHVGRTVARAFDLPVRFVQGRMEDLELPSESFDLAVQNNSLCYLVDRAARRSALEETRRVLRPGGWLVQRNPSRWTPVDQFSSLPLIHLLPPSAADRAAAAIGRRRSRVRLSSPLEARRELAQAGFERIARAETPGRRKALRALSRYQHFVARRPISRGIDT